MLNRRGIAQLWLELAGALVFALAVLLLGEVSAEVPAGSSSSSPCTAGLPALQIELVSADAQSLTCNQEEIVSP